MEVLAQSVFQADLNGKGKLSSLLTKPLRAQGEKVGVFRPHPRLSCCSSQVEQEVVECFGTVVVTKQST